MRGLFFLPYGKERLRHSLNAITLFGAHLLLGNMRWDFCFEWIIMEKRTVRNQKGSRECF